MRRTDVLITASRRSTDNLDYSSTSGIQDSEFIRYLNDAQDRIYSLIQKEAPMVFTSEKEIDSVYSQESYDLPSPVYLGTRIIKVEFSRTGLSRDYYLLEALQIDERMTGEPCEPRFYIRKNSQILINPIPNTSSGKIRVTYQYKLPRLDVRQGTVSSVTLDSGNNTITSLVLNSSLSIGSDEIDEYQYATIVDAYGNVKMSQIPVESINTTTGEVTIASGFVFEDGETISVGNYIVPGKYATTHSKLNDDTERYLLSYCDWKILKRDSSNDSIEQNAELGMMEKEIISAYSTPDNSIKTVNMTNKNYIWGDVY